MICRKDEGYMKKENVNLIEVKKVMGLHINMISNVKEDRDKANSDLAKENNEEAGMTFTTHASTTNNDTTLIYSLLDPLILRARE